MPLPSNARYTVGSRSPQQPHHRREPAGASESTTVHGSLTYVAASNQLQMSRNCSIPALSGLLPLRAGVWNFVEVDYTVHNSAGAWTVRLNDVVIGPTSSLDTRNGGTGVIDNAYIGAQGGNTRGHDDMYVCSGSTSAMPSSPR